MTKAEIRRFTSWLGKRSYKARVANLGLARLQEIVSSGLRQGHLQRIESGPA